MTSGPPAAAPCATARLAEAKRRREGGPTILLDGRQDHMRLILLRLLAVAVSFGAWVTVPALMADDQAAPAKPATREPAKIYADLCANCHGPSLEGGQAQSLLDDVWKFGGDDASLSKSIREGHPEAGMPPMGALLSEAEIKATVGFIRDRAKRRGAPQPAPAWLEGAIVESERHTFKIETVASDLETPWALAFLPDGRILVTERPGRLRIIEKGKLLPTPIAGIPEVWREQDGGLFDVEVHPDYARNGWIYLSYAEGGPDKSSMTVIIRGRVQGHTWVDQETIYRAPPDLYFASNIHYGSRFRFDRGGHLFYSIGDRGRERDAQELVSPFGKIHRVLDDGRAVTDNPFVKRAAAVATIWSYGHRNPQGLAFHPVTGKLWATEHGPRDGDELNRIEPGRNYGWPTITNGIHWGATTVGPTSHEGMEQPIVWWTPAIAPAGIEFYTGDRFPNWKHDLFVTGLVGQALRRLVTDGDTVTHQEVLFKDIGRVRDIVTGPDGYLYVALATPAAKVFLTSPGRIIRLMPSQSKGTRPGATKSAASDGARLTKPAAGVK
jgi:aldose sugar dehydrogenase